jgi:hypothetical protein
MTQQFLALSIVSILSFSALAAEPDVVGESAVGIEKPSALSNLQVEGLFQAPSILGAKGPAIGASVAKQITIDQNLGLQGLVSTDGASEATSAGIFWRRHVLALQNARPFFQADLSQNSVRSNRLNESRQMTSVGLSIGTTYEIMNAIRLGALMGLDIIGANPETGGPTRISGSDQYLSSKLGVMVGIDL